MKDLTKPALDLILYPDSDGQPMTESDATRDYLIYCVEVLRLYFQSRRDVYVSGNLFIYYEEGNPQAVVSPDVFVVFGVSAQKRRSYKVWQENGQLPSFVMEITSNSTKRKDEVEKPQLYAGLGIQEYFQYDPTADYLKPQLKGAHLIDGVYQPLPLKVNSSGISFIHSQVLGLDLQLQTPNLVSGIQSLPLELRFYDPQTGVKLLSLQETEQARTEAEQARTEAEQARTEAEQARTEAEQAREQAIQKAERLAAQLRTLGIDPDTVL
ncbi:MAG: Uma2 family endonuclease [Leptolyngbyaceae cyanobacterium SL_5_9]|nr:Uma2 family endonuclease [Leptolyngbyaceae cyanobacterium SL_5_9]NJO72543.1 Uma2 family endonuclease [Leptolyngbyaceae cyanobacterium RM1_406_9]